MSTPSLVNLDKKNKLLQSNLKSDFLYLKMGLSCGSTRLYHYFEGLV